MGAAAGLWSAGCLPQKPAYSSLSLETSPNLQASGGGGAGGESQQEAPRVAFRVTFAGTQQTLHSLA